MENKQPSMIDLLIETHIDLDRQGPGSHETTLKALSFLENIDKISEVADLGCGSGGQTIILAGNLDANIVGVDLFADFVDVLNDNAKKKNLSKRVKGVVGSMEDLSFEKEKFDLIWSEGAIDNIGFEKGLSHWNEFLKKDGYVAVSCPSWLTDEHPDEVEKFWLDAGSKLDTVEYNISAMQSAGYSFVASFALPQKCWTDNYFIPRKKALEAILKKYPNNKDVKDFIADNEYEVELYSKYSKHYGYVFYIGKKI